jgi:hypothetical protein
MESILFTFQLGFMLIFVFWAVKNDRAGDDDTQQGLFAVRSNLSTLSTDPQARTPRAVPVRHRGHRSKKEYQK